MRKHGLFLGKLHHVEVEYTIVFQHQHFASNYAFITSLMHK